MLGLVTIFLNKRIRETRSMLSSVSELTEESIRGMNLRLRAISDITRITFFSAYYHTKTNDWGHINTATCLHQ